MAMDNVKKFFSVEMSPYVKITGVELRENNQPTEEELPKIKKHYKKANTENVAVFELSFCNTIPDRQDDIFTDTSIDTLVRTVVGKQLINGHDTEKDAIGKIFDSYVKNVDYVGEDGKEYKDIKTGFIKVYIPKIKRLENVIEDLETGMKEFTSPGFTIEKVVCSICGKDYLHSDCEHIKGRVYDGQKCYTILEAKECAEVSLVYLGAQYYSQIVKNLDGGEDMELKELQAKFETVEKEFNEYKEKYSVKSFEDLNANVEELNTKINDLTASNEKLSTLVKVFGEDVSVEELNTVKANAEIGKSAKEETISEIKRLKALVDAARGINSSFDMTKFLDNADYDYLKEFEKSLVEEAKVIPVGKQTETVEVEVKTNKQTGNLLV